MHSWTVHTGTEVSMTFSITHTETLSHVLQHPICLFLGDDPIGDSLIDRITVADMARDRDGV